MTITGNIIPFRIYQTVQLTRQITSVQLDPKITRPSTENTMDQDLALAKLEEALEQALYEKHKAKGSKDERAALSAYEEAEAILVDIYELDDEQLEEMHLDILSFEDPADYPEEEDEEDYEDEDETDLLDVDEE